MIQNMAKYYKIIFHENSDINEIEVSCRWDERNMSLRDPVEIQIRDLNMLRIEKEIL
jgi:hypothetical protein